MELKPWPFWFKCRFKRGIDYESIVLLYYRRPHSGRELVCACESETAALSEIRRLSEDFTDLYPESMRFETALVCYVRRT